MTANLTTDEIAQELGQLQGWKLAQDGGAIAKGFVFQDFTEAFAFMTRTALIAEKLDHHPDWSNVYNRVEVRLNTHDAGGLTAKDFTLAQAIDGIL